MIGVPRQRKSWEDVLADIDGDLRRGLAAKAEGEQKVRELCADLLGLDESLDDLWRLRKEVMDERDAARATGGHERRRAG